MTGHLYVLPSIFSSEKINCALLIKFHQTVPRMPQQLLLPTTSEFTQPLTIVLFLLYVSFRPQIIWPHN